MMTNCSVKEGELSSYHAVLKAYFKPLFHASPYYRNFFLAMPVSSSVKQKWI